MSLSSFQNIFKLGNIFLGLFLCSCDADNFQAPENTVGYADAQTRFPLQFYNGKTVSVRLALTDIERSRGLMGCRKLEPNEGMIFVYPAPNTRAFWMKNVPVDLDIGFFSSAGKLLEVYTMRAYDTETLYSKSDDIQFCLEMPRGWFEKNNILPETNPTLKLESLRNAMHKRGFNYF